MNARFTDLNFIKLTDGTIRLEQIGYAGESSVIDLHPMQLQYIAQQLAGPKPESTGKVADLERKIGVLTDKLQNIVCSKAFRTDLIERTANGFEYLARLDALADLALEFDGGRLEPEDDYEAPEAIKPCPPISEPKKTPPEAIAGDSGQLSLV